MRLVLKSCLNALLIFLVCPAFLLYRLGALVVGPEKAFPGWSQLFSLIPGLSGVYLRRAFYRLTLPACGPDVWLSFGTLITQHGARFGRGVSVGAYCCLADLNCGDDVQIASHVSVTSGARQHGIERLDLPIRMQPGTPRRVAIGRDSWIGERSVVMADVGCHCVIGAGSVVTRPIPDYAIAAGVPARVVRYRQAHDGSEPACPTVEQRSVNS